MADSELAAKLARRQHKIEEFGDGPVILEPNDKANSNGQQQIEEISLSSNDELRNRLIRRQEINDGKEVAPNPVKVVVNVYTEFHEVKDLICLNNRNNISLCLQFTRKQIKSYEGMFKRWI